MECLKLYDKQENGTMLLAELEHSLKALGELNAGPLIDHRLTLSFEFQERN